jgi:Holliday junction resolvasome RuvABC endonuclease subunit
MRVIGLDASTTTIGISIIDFDGYNLTLVYNDFYKPDKDDDLLFKIKKAKMHVGNLCSLYSPDVFVIEDYVKFMKGASSAATTIPLAVMNMTLRLMANELYELTPQCLNVLKIRHALKLTNELPEKHEMPEIVAYHLGLKEFPWRKKINRKKEEVIMEESYDMADAMAVALAWIKTTQTPKIKKSRKK